MYFDIQNPDDVEVKQEQVDHSGPAAGIVQSPNRRRLTLRGTHRTASLPARVRNRDVDIDAESPLPQRTSGDKDDVLISILSQGWDMKMTDMAIDRVLQHAQQAATASDHLGLSYIDSIINHLD